MLGSNDPHPFTLAQYAQYLSLVVKAARDLDRQNHSARSFLDVIQRYTEDDFQEAPLLSAAIGDDMLPVDKEALGLLHRLVAYHVLES